MRTSRSWPCGTCWWTTPVSKAAGLPVNWCAIWTANAGCAAISIPWPRRWKTFCATPYVTHRPKASCVWAGGVTVTTGCCGWKTRAVVSTTATWNGSLHPSFALM
nr:hypothetical protein [Tanacetum cinerariifolium]